MIRTPSLDYSGLASNTGNKTRIDTNNAVPASAYERNVVLGTVEAGLSIASSVAKAKETQQAQTAQGMLNDLSALGDAAYSTAVQNGEFSVDMFHQLEGGEGYGEDVGSYFDDTESLLRWKDSSYAAIDKANLSDSIKAQLRDSVNNLYSGYQQAP